MGTEKSCGGKKDYVNHFISDVTKLINAKDKGIFIHIHRNFIKSQGGGQKEANNRDKIKKYENITKDLIDLIKVQLKDYENFEGIGNKDFEDIAGHYIEVIDYNPEDKNKKGKFKDAFRENLKKFIELIIANKNNIQKIR